MLLHGTLNRFHAFGLHLLVSAGVAVFSSGLVFLLWYPGLLAFASGVGNIFFVLLLVDVVLGPAITLIIFNPRKKELKRDLTVVVAIQVAALLYGLYTVFLARPVYMAFNADRIDLVYANDISVENLSKAIRPEFRSLPYLGPQIIAAPLPHDPEIRNQIMVAALSGGDDVQQLPQYYVPYADQKAEVLKRLRPLEGLKTFNKDKPQKIDALVNKYAMKYIDVGYLPLKCKVSDLVVIVNRTSGDVIEITDLRPWN